MKSKDQLDKRYRSIAWGAVFVLIGILSLVPGDQTMWGMLGSGVILLGLNVTRLVSKLAMGAFSITVGAIAFLSGGLLLIRSQLGLHFNVELIPIILIVIGVYWLLPRQRADDASCM